MKTLISILVVSGEAEMNNANSHGEPKSVHLVLLSVYNNYRKIETIKNSKRGYKYLTWPSQVWTT